MSKNLNYKQATNVERRTWDRESYEAKAKSRAQAEQTGPSLNKGPMPPMMVGQKRGLLGPDQPVQEEFIPAADGSVGPERSERAFLKSRQGKVDIDSKIGMTEMISAEAVASSSIGDAKDGVTKTGVGWHCKVCDCFLKDSLTYLDHINGRKHQRSLGYSMRVEQNTKDQVKVRLLELAKQNEKQLDVSDFVGTNFENVVKDKEEELRRRQEERLRNRQERKKRIHAVESNKDFGKESDEDEDDAELDPAMAAMMGFSGFGGGNKK